jgi:hypothetical protein
VAEVAFMLALLLVCLGRAVGVLLVWVTAVAVLVIAARSRGTPSRRCGHSDLDHPAARLAPAAHYLLPIALLAAAAAAITTPAVARLLRRTLLG